MARNLLPTNSRKLDSSSRLFILSMATGMTIFGISKIFPEQRVESFHDAVRAHLSEELRGLDPKALLKVKALLKAGSSERNSPEAANLRESYAQTEQFVTKVPQTRFGQLARKEIRHKL